MKKKKKNLDETVDYSVGARVLHTSSSPSYALCCRNLTVQLLVLPSPDKVAWAEKLLLIMSSILSLPGTDPLLCEGSCISTLAERSPACISIIVAKMTLKKKTQGIHHSQSPLVLKNVDFSAPPDDPAEPPRSNTNSEREKVNLTVSDSVPHPPPKVHLSVMYITVRVFVSVHVCEREKQRQSGERNGTITVRCVCVCSPVCVFH